MKLMHVFSDTLFLTSQVDMVFDYHIWQMVVQGDGRCSDRSQQRYRVCGGEAICRAGFDGGFDS